MHKQFRADKNWEGYEKPGVHFHIMKERNSSSASGADSKQGKKEQWEPCKHDACEDSPVHQLQRLAFEMGLAKKLEYRAPYYHREVGYFLEDVRGGARSIGYQGFSRVANTGSGHVDSLC